MKRILVAILAAGTVLAACSKEKAPALTADEARAIAKEAYIYGFPIVDSYRIQYSFFADPQSPEYKGNWNEVHSSARVFTPEDRTVQTPNSDTPYSMLGLDLRQEPVVITVPEIEQGRYYSLQFVDAYTFNFAYVGSRATGNEGGNYMVAGPGWSGDTPPGVKQVIPCETQFALVIFRTQLFNPADITQVVHIQEQYRAKPLSQFLGTEAPEALPDIAFPHPLTPEEQKTSPRFFEILNFELQFCPANPSETALMERFAKINVGAGMTFDINSMKPEIQQAIKDGMSDAWADFKALQAEAAEGKVTSGDMFGTREFLQNNYLYRMTAAVTGIYGNSKEEAMYPLYLVDSDGQPLTGENKYTIRVEKDQLPPVNSFWSLTMYEMPASLLYANALDRYLINSPMVPKLDRAKDGSITIYFQHASPGPKHQSNWLPAPAGPFIVVLRMYWPKQEALDGTWKVPPMTKVE